VDDWPAILAYYTAQLDGWRGPAPAPREISNFDARSWEKDGVTFTLRQSRTVPTDLDSPLGARVSAYAIGIAVKKSE
jgi:hypothetical protein